MKLTSLAIGWVARYWALLRTSVSPESNRNLLARHGQPLIALALTIAALAAPVMARDNDAWEANPPEVRQWYRGLMQPDNPNISCCGESDGYFADSFEVKGDQYIAIITDTRDVPGRPTIKPGTKIVVPNQKLKYDAGNPTGHGVIFVKYDEEAEAFTVYCYVVPGGV